MNLGGVRERVEVLDKVEPKYVVSYLISLFSFMLFCPLYAAIYLFTLAGAWKFFDKFQYNDIWHFSGTIFSVIALTSAAWFLFLSDASSLLENKIASDYIFVPPTFVFFALFFSMLGAGIITIPITLILKIFFKPDSQ